jgi:hypothetical protein
MAAYIDLNPVRAGMVEDPADYRWSSYGEAVGGGRGARKAQQGLVRALYSFGKKEVTGRSWAQGGVGKDYRHLLIESGMEETEVPIHSNPTEAQSKSSKVVTRKGMKREKATKELDRLSKEKARDLKISKLVRCRIRYFTDGVVIGSKDFVNGIFERHRERFGPKRKDGARRPRGALGGMAGEIWSLRDLQQDHAP